MAQSELIASIIERFNTFSFTGKPVTMWDGIPPLTNPDGTATSLPIVSVFDDSAGDLTGTFEHMYEEYPIVRMEGFATTRANAKKLVQGLMFNGGDPGAGTGSGAGFHYADSLPLTSAWQFLQMHAIGKPIYKELVDRDNTASRVHQVTIRFQVQARQLTAV